MICEIVEKYLLFTYPIGWDELGVIATIVAVVVALAANKGASKQLVKALEMQEQSKNVGLLEQRIRQIDLIQENKMPSETSIKILFNSSILAHFVELQEQQKRYVDAENDEKTFFEAVEATKEFRDASNDVKSKIEEFEYVMARPDCPTEIFEQYKTYCNQSEQWWSETGLSDDRRTYNHAEIRERMIGASQEIKVLKSKIVAEMEDYIANSIAPVHKK